MHWQSTTASKRPKQRVSIKGGMGYSGLIPFTNFSKPFIPPQLLLVKGLMYTPAALSNHPVNGNGWGGECAPA